MPDNEYTLGMLTQQVERLVSDVESEKETRKRTNDQVNGKLDTLVAGMGKVDLILQRHDQTLYGETGENGMRKDVKTLQKESQDNKVEGGKLKARGSVIAGTVRTSITLGGAGIKQVLK